MSKTDNLKPICTVINAVILWSILEAVALTGEKLSPKWSSDDKNANASRWLLQKSNETKSSASFDSFRVSRPEINDGTLLLDSYHDFGHKHHHRSHYPNHGHHYGAREDTHHHPGHSRTYNHAYDHHGYPYLYHNGHHRHPPYPSDDVGSEEVVNPDGATDGVDSVNNADEVTEPMVDSEIPVEPTLNGELFDPETEQPETLEEPTVTEDPIESGVREIPIEEVPGEPVDGGMVSNDLRYLKTFPNYGHKHYDPLLSNTYDHRYPIFSHLPPTHFKCTHVKHTGYSSDIEARCQVILPGNRSRKWEVLHFLHKSSPRNSNAVIYLDHGGHHPRYHNHYTHNYHHPHHSHSLYPHHSHHYDHSNLDKHYYNGHHYPGINYS